MEEKIRTGINQFVKMAASTGFDFKNKKIWLKADLADDTFDIQTIDAFVKLKRGEGVAMDIPVLPDDDVEAMIELAGAISERATRYLTALKGNKNRSAKARSASAKKALEARWAKRLQKDD